MNELTRRIPLKDKLDTIDDAVYKDAYDGVYGSKIRILVGMWAKGEAISVEFRGVKSTPSYRELERKTGRSDDSLKKWHELYLKYPKKQDYLPIAEEKAKIWTDNLFQTKLPKPDKEFEPKIYDIWNFQGIDDRFGQEHPGNIPAGIVLNTLYYYTNEDDLVVDPMAGGGVTIDCCKHLNRKFLAYDIKPKRNDIKQLNILQGYPKEAKGCDLIFLDPPYYKKKEEDYGEDSISALTTEQYWIAFEKIAKHSLQCVKKNGFLAFLMEPYIDYDNANNSIWLYHYINKFLEANWQVERIFDAPENSQRYAAYDVARAKEKKQILTLRRQLVIFRKGKNEW